MLLPLASLIISYDSFIFKFDLIKKKYNVYYNLAFFSDAFNEFK